ncbi:hypothetical protein BH09VER1_BH09VER1_23090 [soil metagenome]
MKFAPLLSTLGLACLAATAQAQNVIVNGNFEGGSAGGPPPKPWIVSSEITKAQGVAVVLETLPGTTDGKLWLRMHDENPEVPSGTFQNFPEVKTGRFTVKVYFQKIGLSFGVYLGGPKVSGPETRIVDFKVINGKSTLGNAGPRSKTNFTFQPDKLYPLFVNFETSADGSKVKYEVGLEDTGEVIASAEVDAKLPLSGLRFTTDSKDKDTDVYVTDVSLVPKG